MTAPLLQEPPELLTIEEAARLLRIGRSRGYALAASGQLPGLVRLGRSLRVSRRALLRWVDAHAGEGFLEVIPRRG